MRLICCHHSGAGASSYHPWVKYLPDFMELKAIQLPGRESRLEETLLTDIAQVIDSLGNEFLTLLDKPYILFGHSLGALIAYELCQKLQFQKALLPTTLIVSGCRAPHLPRSTHLHKLTEPEFIKKLFEYNGTPNEILNNSELLELFLPILRADFCISETYCYQPSPPLACNLIVLGGKKDNAVSIASLEAWKTHTTSAFKLHLFPGDHFFIKSYLSDVLQVINEIADFTVQGSDFQTNYTVKEN